MRRGVVTLVLMAAAISGCDRRGGSAACGIQALTEPAAIRELFGTGGALDAAPTAAPSSIAVRLVVGPAWPAAVTRDSTGWRVVTRGAVPAQAHPGYGVLVTDSSGRSLGILVYEGDAVRGATRLGTLVIGDTTLPLLGVQLGGGFNDTSCALFPDSLR